MSELDMQKYLIDAVNDEGGHAFKASNRFLVGVVDLSIKLKEWPHAWIEAKFEKPRIIMDRPFKLDVTTPQKRFLMANRAAGGISGVVSFLKGKGNAMSALFISLTEFERRGGMVRPDDHVLLANRGLDLYAMVENFVIENCNRG